MHHATVAAVLALVVVIFEHHGYLNWLDTVSLRVALSLKTEAAHVVPVASETQAGNVQVVLIGADAFEIAFQQESPLSRPVLTRMIKSIADKSPSVIALDFDLSPGPDGARGNVGQAQLDEALMHLAATGRTHPVLATPFPVLDDMLLQSKFAWMSKLCHAGVRFAYPHINLSQGIAMRFPIGVRSLGVLAHEVAAAPAQTTHEPPPHDTASASHGTASASEEPCSLVKQGIEKAVFLSAMADPTVQNGAAKFGTMLPLDPDALQRTATTAYTWLGDSADPFENIHSGDTVFIGSSYDPRDAFLTLQGTQPGVVFHAASADTLRAPPRNLGHALAFVFDIILGVSAGYLFGWGWGKYNHATVKLNKGQGQSWRLYVHARGWLFANLIILAAWLFLLFALSALLLRAQLWASPAAMVLGVFAKTLLASRHGAFEVTHGDAHGKSSTQTEPQKAARFALIADFTLGAPILLYGAYLAFFAH